MSPSPKPVMNTTLLPGSKRNRLPRGTEHRISARVRRAIEAMVWNGKTRAQAAAEAGITDDALYKAFRKPEVKSAYLTECDVLRTSGRSRALHRLVAISEAADNMPAVHAIRTLHPDFENGDTARELANNTRPGVTIRIVNEQPRAIEQTKPVTIDVTPEPSVGFD